MTLEELKTAAKAGPNVLAAEVTNGPQPASGFIGLHGAVISILVDAGNGIFRRSNHDVLILGYGTPQESAGWVNGLPQPLQVDAGLLGGKVTAAQVETYCNTQWRAANAGATDILDFQVAPIGTKGVHVSGLFHLSTATPQRQARKAFAIWLVDPAGQPTGANIKFMEVT